MKVRVPKMYGLIFIKELFTFPAVSSSRVRLGEPNQSLHGASLGAQSTPLFQNFPSSLSPLQKASFRSRDS